jgi:hypothetical protein
MEWGEKSGPPAFPEAGAVRDRLAEVRLHRLGSADAGLAQISLPWPAVAAESLMLGGLPTAAAALGKWPGADAPRRLLLTADLPDGEAPTQLQVRPGDVSDVRAAAPPVAAAVCFARSADPGFIWERHRLDISMGDRRLGIAMGLRTAGAIHWWEACRLSVIDETPLCRTIVMGGAIPHVLTDGETLRAHSGYSNPWLHVHNWVNGHLFLRLHANGVCEVFAHHINSRFFDDGRDLADAVPVIGFAAPSRPDDTLATGNWDGSCTAFKLGGIAFDVSEATRLASAAHPGRMDVVDDFVVWQPYMGAALYGGVCPQQLTGDPWIVCPEDRLFPRGMARTLRFSFSLSSRSPRIARYLAPHWWYGLNRELQHAPHLPVATADDWRLDACAIWARHSATSGGFEDGAVPRGAPYNAEAREPGPHEPGWDGDVPWAQLLMAYRSGREDDYLWALRSAYHMTDVITDHAAKMMRMHGYAPVAFSVPMNRVPGTLGAYLETGDPYLLETAEAVTEASYRTHRNSWPRLAVGRDACFVRGAVMLYRYFDNHHFRRIAEDGCMAIVESQRADGSFGDQGGGTGIHQWAAYISKVWMACLGTSCVLDYLDIFPDTPQMAGCIVNLADWLLETAWERDGVYGWSYQQNFDGRPQFHNPTSGQVVQLPTAKQWHHDQIGRIMLFASLQTGRADYADAWARSLETMGPAGGGHSMAATAEFLPWVQSRLWQATPVAGGWQITARHIGPRTPTAATLAAPTGDISVSWDGTVPAVDSTAEMATLAAAVVLPLSVGAGA